MAHPTKAGTASTSAEPQAQLYPSTSSTTTPVEAKTQTHLSSLSTPSTVEQKSQNVVDKMTRASPSRSSTCTTFSDAKTSGNASIFSAKPGADASGMNRALRAQEEARRLQFALAQQQVQQYQAMTKQLEVQSGIAMTPSKSVGSSNSTSSTSTTSIVGLTKTSEDLQKLRQEQLARLQQNVQRQAAIAAQAVQKRSNDEWLRNKLLLEQEHMKLLKTHEQQLSQTGKGNTVTTATATSIADSLLAQQQQVIRQQQILRDMLQKQQKQQQAQLQLQMQLKKGKTENATITPATAISKIPAKPYITTAPTYYSVKKKQTKNTFDIDLEALARVCIRVANARTDSEMRQALERMTSWLHRCTELPLLQIAQRDYRDSIAHRQPMLIQQDRWPLDLQVKSEYVTQKIVQMLGAFLLREKNKAAQQQAAMKVAAAAKCAIATAGSFSNASANGIVSSNPTTAITDATSTGPVAISAMTTASSSATVDNTTSTVATATSTVVSKQQGVVAPTSTTPAATDSSSSTTTLVRPVKIPAKRNMAAIEREYAALKAQLQAKQVEINQKAKAKRDAAKLEAAKAVGVICNRETTAAMLAATHKRPLQVDISALAKKQRTDVCVLPSSSSTASYQPSAASVNPISPRVAQQFYDLDWATRTSSESEDKMYLPLKVVSNIMYKILPGAREEDAGVGGTSIKREEQAKSRTLSPAISPSHSSQTHKSSSQDTVSISDEAVAFMQECVTEFLLYFTSEARDLSVIENRRTKKGVGLSISGTNVVKGMENLGFTPYARVLAGYNEKVKASQDAAARKKMERKKLIQQQTVQKAAAAAAATSAANAAKAATAKSLVLPQSYPQAKMKLTPSPLAETSTMSRPGPSVSARIGVITAEPGRTEIATAKPAVAVTTTAPAKPTMKTIPAAPTTHAAPTTKSL